MQIAVSEIAPDRAALSPSETANPGGAADEHFSDVLAILNGLALVYSSAGGESQEPSEDPNLALTNAAPFVPSLLLALPAAVTAPGRPGTAVEPEKKASLSKEAEPGSTPEQHVTSSVPPLLTLQASTQALGGVLPSPSPLPVLPDAASSVLQAAPPIVVGAPVQSVGSYPLPSSTGFGYPSPVTTTAKPIPQQGMVFSTLPNQVVEQGVLVARPDPGRGAGSSVDHTSNVARPGQSTTASNIQTAPAETLSALSVLQGSSSQGDSEPSALVAQDTETKVSPGKNRAGSVGESSGLLPSGVGRLPESELPISHSGPVAIQQDESAEALRHPGGFRELEVAVSTIDVDSLERGEGTRLDVEISDKQAMGNGAERLLGGATPLRPTQSAEPVQSPGVTRIVRSSPELPSAPAVHVVKLELSPPEVGHVQVRVALAEQTVYATVATERVELRNFLLNHQAQIQAGLQAYGLDVGSFQVEVDARHQDGADRQWAFAAGRHASDQGQQDSNSRLQPDLPLRPSREWERGMLSVFA